MNIIILEICKDGRKYFIQGIVKNIIQKIFLVNMIYKTEEARLAVEAAVIKGIENFPMPRI